MQDTSAAAEVRYYELLRGRPALARLRTSIGLTGTVRRLAIQSIRARHPAASDQEVRARLADRLYGRDAAQRLFPGVVLDG